jgi:hypothetical protein
MHLKGIHNYLLKGINQETSLEEANQTVNSCTSKELDSKEVAIYKKSNVKGKTTNVKSNLNTKTHVG